jgi:hypothetical protein
MKTPKVVRNSVGLVVDLVPPLWEDGLVFFLATPGELAFTLSLSSRRFLESRFILLADTFRGLWLAVIYIVAVVSCEPAFTGSSLASALGLFR